MSLRSVALIGVENCAYSFDNLFSYIIPEKYTDILCAGMRVMVPFGNGNKLRQGFVFDVTDDEALNTELKNLKEISSLLDSAPLLSDELIKLALWLRERCFCTYFVAAKALLPGGMCLKTEKTYSCAPDILPEILDSLSDDEKSVIGFLRKKKDFTRESVILKRIGADKNSPILKRMVRNNILSESTDAFTRVNDLSVQLIRLTEDNLCEDQYSLTSKQASVTDVLRDIGAATIKELCYFTGVSESVVRTLISKGVCEVFTAPIQREVKISEVSDKFEKPILSDLQRKVYSELYEAYSTKSHKAGLLFGVTGSGKTSVYLELIDAVLRDGKNVIVLVPEISLTPQTFSIFSRRYGKDIAVLHSGLSMGERHDEWKRIASGKVRVVIGTRSAVFAPIDNLGLIIIDEEQEHTYKSEMSPRYNAKEVARFRCGYHNAFLLLASATPSIETYAKAQNGQLLFCELSNRYGKAVLPDVFTVDMTDKSLLSSFFAISDPLAEEIGKNIENKEQSILLVNRRGYNTFVVCSDCKKVLTCPKCSISMTYHSANNRLMCHYCGYSIPFAMNCPTCGAENIRYAGFGTQRVEQELKIRFPDAKVIRMDADTTASKNSHGKVLSSFANGEYDILIGTQMVAKGLDFPNVTLVGITSADKELYNNDFRSAERSFDLITQVVGRAGRGTKKGRAVIQTVSPDNHIISIASKQDYKAFYKAEINLRKALIYPPFCDLCEINFSGLSQENVLLCANTFFEKIVSLNENKFSDQKIIVLGPMFPRVSKINEFYRQRILIKCKNTSRFREFVDAVLKDICSDKAFKDVSVYADMNPENLN
ncbi:MAG: primosomal protein N' [Clostridia bacterium]|nr:primosomal protein N' [Clostridia bacterium]